MPFFQSMGFYVPERKAVSDFLQEVTSPKDQAVSLFTMHGHTYIYIYIRYSVLMGLLYKAYLEEDHKSLLKYGNFQPKV